jgi:hypothetical protein
LVRRSCAPSRLDSSRATEVKAPPEAEVMTTRAPGTQREALPSWPRGGRTHRAASVPRPPRPPRPPPAARPPLPRYRGLLPRAPRTSPSRRSHSRRRRSSSSSSSSSRPRAEAEAGAGSSRPAAHANPADPAPPRGGWLHPPQADRAGGRAPVAATGGDRSAGTARKRRRRSRRRSRRRRRRRSRRRGRSRSKGGCRGVRVG